MLLAMVIFGIAAGAYFIWALRKFENAVLALPLFFPLYLVKMEVKGIPCNFIELLAGLLVLAFVCRTVYFYFFASGKSLADKFKFFRADIVAKIRANKVPAALVILCVLFVIAGFISTMITQEKTLMLDGVSLFFGRRTALGMLKGWIIIPVIVFALFLVAVRKSKDILTLLNYYSVSAVILALYALFQVITASYVTPDARASGPFESANYLSLYIAPALVYSLIRLKEAMFFLSVPDKSGIGGLSGFLKLHVRRSARPLEHLDTMAFSGAFFVLLLALLFSKSYAAMVAVGVSIAAFFCLEYYQYFKSKIRKGLPWKGIITVLIVSVILAGFVYVLDPEKWNNLFNFAARNSSSVRVQVYTIASHLLISHWLTGIGLGQFPLYYQLESLSVLGRPPYELNMLHPHNFYVALWLNLGFLGFLSVMGIIYLAIRECCAHVKTFAWARVNEISKIRVIGLSLLLIILVHGFFDTPFFKNDLALIFWLITVVMLAPVGEDRQKH